MSKYKDITSFFQEEGPEDIERFVDKNLDIVQQAYALMEAKGWAQKDLARELGKTTAEVSKWLSGSHNLTLRSIAKMEVALGADLILTPQKASQKYKKIEYVTLAVHANINRIIPGDIRYSKAAERTSVLKEEENEKMVKVA